MGYNGETCTKITHVYPDKIQKDNKLAKTTTVRTSPNFLWLIENLHEDEMGGGERKNKLIYTFVFFFGGGGEGDGGMGDK